MGRSLIEKFNQVPVGDRTKWIEAAVLSVRSNRKLWPEYKSTIFDAEGLDQDFPEDKFDGPVGQLWLANNKVRAAGLKSCTELGTSILLVKAFMDRAFESARREALNERT